jgi:hypothetical protein
MPAATAMPTTTIAVVTFPNRFCMNSSKLVDTGLKNWPNILAQAAGLANPA